MTRESKHDFEDGDESKGGSKGCDDKVAGSSASSLAAGGVNVAEAKELTDRELITSICEYFFDNEALQQELETWCSHRDRSKLFSPLDREYTLEQTALFQEFSVLFETRLEGFLGTLGKSVEGLYEAIRRDASLGNVEFHSGNTLVAVINASVDFKNFHAMMCDARAGEFIWGMPPLMDEKTGDLDCSRP